MNLCVDVFAPFHTPLHNARMDIPTILKGIAEAAKVKQTGLGKLIGVSQPQISRYLKGAEPKAKSYDKIVKAAKRYGVLPTDVRSEDVAAALPASPQGPTVKIKGYVGAGSEAHFYALAHDDYEEVPAPRGASEQTVAMEIRGKSMGPLLSGWLVFYDDVRSPVTPDLIGPLCVVGLTDGQILVKAIQRNGRGGFRLLANSKDDPIEGVQIEWAAKVIDMKPRLK